MPNVMWETLRGQCWEHGALSSVLLPRGLWMRSSHSNLPFIQLQSSQSISAVWLLLKATREGSVPGLSPWYRWTCFPCVFTFFSFVCISVQISLFYKDTSHWMKAHPYYFIFHLMTTIKTPCPNKVISCGTRGWAFNIEIFKWHNWACNNG